MNRYSKVVILALTTVLLVALIGCHDEPDVEIYPPLTVPSGETVVGTQNGEVIPTEEGTEPEGAGSAVYPGAVDRENMRPTVDNKPENEQDPSESTKPNDKTDPSEDAKPNDITNPTEDTEPGDTTDPTEDTEPNDTTDPTEDTEPNDSTDPAEGTDPEDGPCCEYSEYLAMTAAEQQEFMKKFPNTKVFIEWCREAEATHKEHDDSTIVEGGELDVGDFIDKNKGDE